MRAGVWLSGIAAGFGFVAGAVSAIDGSFWMLVPFAASTLTALAWSEQRGIWWGVVATLAHWTAVLLVVIAWSGWVFFALPWLAVSIPGAVAQTIALFPYGRARPNRPRPVHA